MHAAHDAFISFKSSFTTYKRRLRKVAPLYDQTSNAGGSPFDMWHHLELLDRMSLNFTRLFEESDFWWHNIQFEPPPRVNKLVSEVLSHRLSHAHVSFPCL